MSRAVVSIPDKMCAVLIHQFRGDTEIGDAPVLWPGRGQVLIRMAASPINPSDLAFLKGGYGNPKDFPLIPGFEGSGTVAAAGSGLFPRFLLGKRVACATNAAFGGTWAEYLLTTASSCVPLPRDLSFEQGATAIVNPMTALVFFEIAKEERHAAIVSTAAAGALGRMILKLGLRENIPVIHIVRRPEQADLLFSIGGEHVLNSTDFDFVNRFQMLTKHLKATLLLDAVGGELTGQLIKASPVGSSLVSYGFLSAEPPNIDTRLLAKDDKRVIGFFLPNWLKRKHPVTILRMIAKVRKLLATDLATTVQKRFPLEEINQAIASMKESATSGKVLLTMS